MRWISSLLKPSGVGRATPGCAATSYSSATSPCIRNQRTDVAAVQTCPKMSGDLERPDALAAGTRMCVA